MHFACCWLWCCTQPALGMARVHAHCQGEWYLGMTSLSLSMPCAGTPLCPMKIPLVMVLWWALALPMHKTEQPPANAYAQHNRVTRATAMGHKGAPPQGMLTDMLVMPRCPSHWQRACTLAMPKAGWVHHQSQQQATMYAPQCISQATRANPQGLPPSISQPFSTTNMGWLVLPIVLWRH